MSRCDELRPDVLALTKELAYILVNDSSALHSDESHRPAEETKRVLQAAGLFNFMAGTVLAHRSTLRQKGLSLTYSKDARKQDTVSLNRSRRTRSQRRGSGVTAEGEAECL